MYQSATMRSVLAADESAGMDGRLDRDRGGATRRGGPGKREDRWMEVRGRVGSGRRQAAACRRGKNCVSGARCQKYASISLPGNTVGEI